MASIVVTGGTKGIGKAIITKFAEQGFDVAVCSRNNSDLENLKKELAHKGIKVFAEPIDISDKAQVKKFAENILNEFDTIDILVNNAGVFIPGKISTEEDTDFETQMHTNLFSAYYLTRELIGKIKNQKQGHIFNICSTASITPYINGGSYCISKYALYGMTKVLREEMKEFGVKVTAILPGATLTASWEGTDLPPERFVPPVDVAEALWSAYNTSPSTVIEEILIRPQLGDIV